ncbi:MAG: type IX secretion system membrane protein PorP/SprF [Bacteroidetes bacterium]|jgi:type IX secretion system PorP/SprF family membrane protein|nr:type IX secretion system membrane protein PorP/SprF [Bacteroidota bacterium]
MKSDRFSFLGKLGFILLTITVLLGFEGKAQDVAFSQFYANPLYLNPAYAGNTACGRLNLNYRNQWPSLSKAYVTYNVSYDQSLAAINSGYGIMVLNDQQGDGALTHTSINAYYSYKLQLASNMDLSFGVKGAYLQEKLAWEKLIFADQINPVTGHINVGSGETAPDNNQVSGVDFGAGLLFGYENFFFAGIAADHLTEPEMSFYANDSYIIPMKLTFHSGLVINATEGGFGQKRQGDITIEPNLMYVQQGDYKQLNAGMYVNMYPFVLGGWFRHAFENIDAVMILAGIKYENFMIGYSYDYTLSKLGGNSGGAHEISFAWNFCIIRDSKRVIRTINSPGF